MRTPLTPEALQTALATLPNWQLENGEIARTLTFDTFPHAIDFVNAAAALAEAVNHHPDIDIRYNRVRLALVTHDAGGITRNDIIMAAKLDAAAPSRFASSKP
jgi:4a-hydroxytetrahydrobiopterin dehydratase